MGAQAFGTKAWLGISGKLQSFTPFFFCQEFGLARFKSNVTKTMKGFEYILAKLQGEGSGHKEKLESSPSCPDLCGVCGYHHPTLSLGLLISPLGQIPPFQWGLAQRG